MKSTIEIVTIRIGNYSDVWKKMEIIIEDYLTPLEKIRMNSYFRIEEKVNFTLGRYLVRKLLWIPKNDFLFWKNGKPFLSDSSATFNISHTEGIVAVAISRDGLSIWIDVENEHAEAFQGINSTLYLHPNEGRLLSSGNGILKIPHIWVLKEAFLKASGTGIAERLTQTDTLSLTESYGHFSCTVESFVLACAVLRPCDDVNFTAVEMKIEDVW